MNRTAKNNHRNKIMQGKVTNGKYDIEKSKKQTGYITKVTKKSESRKRR